MRRLAYADPPYPGQKDRYAPGTEVDHPELVAKLAEYDGWALSTSAAALLDVWKLAPHARCAAWLKTWAVNGWSRVRWSWEPVLFVTDRKGLKPGQRPGKGGGSKPYEFVRWVLGLLDFQPGDELVDLFPGSGAVSRFAKIETPDLFETAPGGSRLLGGTAGGRGWQGRGRSMTTSGYSWEGCPHCGHFVDWHVGHGDSRFRCHKCGCTIDRDLTLLSGGAPPVTEGDA